MTDIIDFYDELNKSDSDDEDENICLISHTLLNENKITLICSHSFNFKELYNEVVSQKYRKRHFSKDNVLNTLRTNEFICPYCRKIQTKLLPYITDTNNKITRQYKVNKPEKFCMSWHKCSHIFKVGKKKGELCNNIAFLYNGIAKCNKHNEIKTINTPMTKTKCKAILKSGPRKGMTCDAIAKNGEEYCKRHMSIK